MTTMSPQALICTHAQIMNAPIFVCSTGILADATPVSIVVPDEATYVVFDRSNVAQYFFAKKNAVAAVPSTLDNTGVSAVVSPREWYLGAPATGRTISIITDTSGVGLIVTCSFATGLTTGTGTDRTIGY